MVDGSCNVVRPAILMRSCFPYDPPRRAAIRSWKIFERERERDSLLSFSKNRTETTNFLFRMFEKRRQEFIPNWSDRDVKEGNKR